MLPRMRYSDGIGKAVQVTFGGYNHTLSAGDGELYDMTNLTSKYHPILSTRPKRKKLTTLTKPNGIYARDKLMWVDGTSFFYDGVSKGTVEDSKKVFASMGAYIIIFPDKKYYNTATGVFGGLESSVTSAAGDADFKSGTIYGEAAEANTIYCSGIDFSNYFKPGDAITISGCATHTENNKTPIVREIDGHYLRFSEYTFILDESNTDYTEPGAITFKRSVPDLDFICSNENRLWGCKGDEIYASKLGDIFNWNVFDGISTDSYYAPVGSAGDFTGCVSYMGYPTFFKSGNIHFVYGSVPSNFQVMGDAKTGVEIGSGNSLAISGEILFYLSDYGVVAYSGSMPTVISEQFGAKYTDGVGGSDGLKYYISAKDTAYHLFVYDVKKGLWHKEDSSQALGFAFCEHLYMLLSNGEIWALTDEGTETVSWSAEFGDFTEGPNKKGVSKIQLRLELEDNATLKVEMQFDSGNWITVTNLSATKKRSYYLPIIPRRADHYRLKLSGTGDCKIYSMAREYYSGSEG